MRKRKPHIRYVRYCNAEVDICTLVDNVQSLLIDLKIAIDPDPDEEDDPAISLEEIHDVLETCRDVLTDVLDERWKPTRKRKDER